MATSTKDKQIRSRYIKLIHVARRELCLDEPTYRTILQSAGKADSTASMSAKALVAVLERLKKSGFKVRPKSADRSQALHPEARKVRALWLFLHALGAVQDPSEKALAAYAKRVAKVDDIHWMRGETSVRMIESLKSWAMRYLPQAVANLRQEVAAISRISPLSTDQCARVNYAQLELSKGNGFDLYWRAWEALMSAVGRDVAADIKALEANKHELRDPDGAKTS